MFFYNTTVTMQYIIFILVHLCFFKYSFVYQTQIKKTNYQIYNI